jgi:hypothetical protein
VGGRQMSGRAGERQFFFIHVMKTAGGTLLQQILANFERTAVYPHVRLDPDMHAANYSLAYLARLPQERRDAVSVFTGHFPFVAVELLGIDLTTITIVRDPVERTLSYLRHCRRHHDQHRDLALEEIYEDPFFHPCFIRNHQAKLFALRASDQPRSFMDPLEIDDERLALAKANLEQVDVVGTQDRFEDLLSELEDRFGWTQAPVKNRNVGRGDDRVAPSFRRRIAADNEADVEFFAHAQRLREGRRVAGAPT